MTATGSGMPGDELSRTSTSPSATGWTPMSRAGRIMDRPSGTAARPAWASAPSNRCTCGSSWCAWTSPAVRRCSTWAAGPGPSACPSRLAWLTSTGWTTAPGCWRPSRSRRDARPVECHADPARVGGRLEPTSRRATLSSRHARRRSGISKRPLRKLAAKAIRRVYLTYPADGRFAGDGVCEALGQPRGPLPDYLHVIGILHHLGIDPRLDYLEDDNRFAGCTGSTSSREGARAGRRVERERCRGRARLLPPTATGSAGRRCAGRSSRGTPARPAERRPAGSGYCASAAIPERSPPARSPGP